MKRGLISPGQNQNTPSCSKKRIMKSRTPIRDPQDSTRVQKRITGSVRIPTSKHGILGNRRIFFVFNNKNGRHDFRYRSPARVPVPELRCGRLRLRQRRGVDGRRPLDHLPGGAGGQERWPVLHPVRSVHHSAGHRGVHGDQGSGRECEDQRPPAASLRRDPCVNHTNLTGPCDT